MKALTTPGTDPAVRSKPKHRQPRGSGSVYKLGRIWWIAYYGADRLRHKESSESEGKGDAVTLLESRNGSRVHHLPVIRNAERLTFDDAAKALIDDYTINDRKSRAVVQRRITKHLLPVFDRRRMASIKTADGTAYITHRQQQGIVNRQGVRRGDVGNAEINRELQTLKRTFNVAIEQDRIAMKPTIKLLQEAPARSGFVEPDQIASVLAHLPADIQPVIQFACITGWRIASEVLPLEWRHVDFSAREIRLDAGTTKNRDASSRSRPNCATCLRRSTPSVFQRYNIVSGSDLRDAARKLNVAAGR